MTGGATGSREGSAIRRPTPQALEEAELGRRRERRERLVARGDRAEPVEGRTAEGHGVVGPVARREWNSSSVRTGTPRRRAFSAFEPASAPATT